MHHPIYCTLSFPYTPLICTVFLNLQNRVPITSWIFYSLKCSMKMVESKERLKTAAWEIWEVSWRSLVQVAHKCIVKLVPGGVGTREGDTWHNKGVGGQGCGVVGKCVRGWGNMGQSQSGDREVCSLWDCLFAFWQGNKCSKRWVLLPPGRPERQSSMQGEKERKQWASTQLEGVKVKKGATCCVE